MITDAPSLAISVPAPNLGDESVLNLVISPTRLVQIINGQDLANSGVLVAVTDGTGHLIARSRSPERYIGQAVPDWDKLQALNADSGVFHAKSAEGEDVAFAFETIRGTPGWFVVVGEPMQAFDARWRQPLQELGAGVVLAACVAIVLASFMTGTILRPLRALAGRARAVASGAHEAHGEVARSSIAEFESLRAGMESAEDALRDRAEQERHIARQLAISEHRYRTLAGIGTLVFWRANALGKLISVPGWSKLSGLPESEALSGAWPQVIHLDDRDAASAAWANMVVHQTPIDHEFRIRDAAGEWRWVRSRGALIAQDVGEPIEWVGVLEDIDARRKAQADLIHMAHHDALTGLPNRAQFHAKLSEALACASNHTEGALLFVDLDRFKEVNDTFGHPVGDALLVAVADRIRAATGPTATIARLGGDEFAVIQRDGDQPQSAAALSAELIERLSAPYDLQGRQILIGASVGIEFFSQEQDQDRLLANADMALYCAKQDGRGRYAIYQRAKSAA
jgi:diguanylate cyclase (GGDEF)-like protein/PAS domain S-box-containing protein